MHQTLNLQHLKFFCDAVSYQSISEAAKVNFVTQSAVSQGIKKLESVLKTSLLFHNRQKFQLTEEGKIVFEHARHVFKSIQNIQHQIHRDKATIQGDVKLVTTKSLGMAFLPYCYKTIRASFPELNLRINLGGLNYIRQTIKKGEVEFGLVVYDENFAQFEKKPLKKGSFNLYQNIQTRHVENEVLVNYFEGTHVHALRAYLEEHSSLKIHKELSGWEVIARFVEMDLGIGFFPDYIMNHHRYPQITLYPLEIPQYEYEICAIYNKGEKLSRAACAFLDQFSLLYP